MSHKPHRGEVWLVNLEPTKGHEQGGTRPALIISDDRLNHSPAEIVVILPITTKDKRIRTHVRVEPAPGGLQKTSFIKCEDVRSVSTERLVKLLGTVDTRTVAEVEYRICIILGLPAYRNG